jgi:hypothetical protein
MLKPTSSIDWSHSPNEFLFYTQNKTSIKNVAVFLCPDFARDPEKISSITNLGQPTPLKPVWDSSTPTNHTESQITHIEASAPRKACKPDLSQASRQLA